MQSAAFPAVFLSNVNVVVSAPTGSGKTGVMELAILRLMQRYDAYVHACKQAADFHVYFSAPVLARADQYLQCHALNAMLLFSHTSRRGAFVLQCGFVLNVLGSSF